MYRKTLFQLNAVETLFEGYTCDQYWNGHGCPYFEENVARDILQGLTRFGYTWRFETGNQAIVCTHKDDPDNWEPEVFSASFIEVNEHKVKVYSIGAFSWTWAEAQLTTRQASIIANCTASALRHAIGRGDLSARKHGRDWNILAGDLLRWLHNPDVHKTGPKQDIRSEI